MQFNKKEFLRCINNLIGTDTRDNFAKKCGIGKTNLYRMLNEDHTAPPSKTTLAKIAENTEASLDELFVLCGYAESPAEARKQHGMPERIRLNAADMQTGFAELCKNIVLYRSLDDYISKYLTLYSHEECKYAYGNEIEYDGDLHPTAERYVNAFISFGEEGTCYTYFVIYFAKTKGGLYVILDVGMDGNSLLEANFATEKQLSRMGVDKGSLAGKSYVYYFRETKEQRLLRAVFGQRDESETYTFTIVGFGFEFPVVRCDFKEFIRAHRSCFSEGSLPLKYLDEDPDEDAELFFLTYYDSVSHDSGVQAVVAEVMRKETGLPFAAYTSTDSKTGEVSTYVMLPDENIDAGLGLGDLKRAVAPYVRELNLRRYGECVVYQVRHMIDDLQFTVEED